MAYSYVKKRLSSLGSYNIFVIENSFKKTGLPYEAAHGVSPGRQAKLHSSEEIIDFARLRLRATSGSLRLVLTLFL